MEIDTNSLIVDKEQLINFFKDGSKASGLKIVTEH